MSDTNKKLTLAEAVASQDADEHNSNITNLAQALRHVRKFQEDATKAIAAAELLAQQINIAGSGTPSYEDTKRLYHEARSLSVKAPTV